MVGSKYDIDTTFNITSKACPFGGDCANWIAGTKQIAEGCGVGLSIHHSSLRLWHVPIFRHTSYIFFCKRNLSLQRVVMQLLNKLGLGTHRCFLSHLFTCINRFASVSSLFGPPQYHNQDYKYCR